MISRVHTVTTATKFKAAVAVNTKVIYLFFVDSVSEGLSIPTRASNRLTHNIISLIRDY